MSRQVLASGPLSVQAPPSGIGRYDTSISVNLASDTQLDSEANWILHVATVNESRYPDIEVNLARAQLAPSTTRCRTSTSATALSS